MMEVLDAGGVEADVVCGPAGTELLALGGELLRSRQAGCAWGWGVDVSGGRPFPSPGPTWGNHSRRLGKYQFQSPSSVIVAGSRTPRTSVASMKTATAKPTPSCLKMTRDKVAKIANTDTITAAALVTTPAVLL